MVDRCLGDPRSDLIRQQYCGTSKGTVAAGEKVRTSLHEYSYRIYRDIECTVAALKIGLSKGSIAVNDVASQPVDLR